MTAQLIITHFMLAAKNTYDQEVGGWKGKHVFFFIESANWISGLIENNL